MCPFLVDRAAVGLNFEAPIPPDACELNACTSAYLSEQMQARKQAGHNASIRAAPTGLEPHDNFEQGLLVPSSLDDGQGIAHDLDFAVRTVSEKKKALKSGVLCVP